MSIFVFFKEKKLGFFFVRLFARLVYQLSSGACTRSDLHMHIWGGNRH
jgi:hypothetical protein